MKIVSFAFIFIFVGFSVFSQESTISLAFSIPMGIGQGEVGPKKDEIIRLKNLPKPISFQDSWGVKGIGIDQNGNVVVLDNYNKKLLYFTPSGKLIKEIEGIGGSLPDGQPMGIIKIVKNFLILLGDHSFTVYNLTTKELLNFVHLFRLSSPFPKYDYEYALIETSMFFKGNGDFWWCPDVADKNSKIELLNINDIRLSKLNITELNSDLVVDGKLPLIKDLYNYRTYQSIENFQNYAGHFIGNFKGLNTWIGSGNNIFVGPIRNQLIKINVSSYISKNFDLNTYFEFSVDGFVYFTAFNSKTYQTNVYRLDLKPYLDQKNRSEP